MSSLTEQITQYWDERAKGYSLRTSDELTSSKKDSCQRLLKKALVDLPDPTVLDIGCGAGAMSLMAAELGFKVTGTDASHEMLSQAQSNAQALGLSALFLTGSAEKPEFDDHSFSAVISRNVLWNLSEPEAALREYLRILKPGGTLFYIDGNHYRYLIDPEYALWRRNAPVPYGHQSKFLQNVNTGKMEAIAAKLPLTGELRPQWDQKVLDLIGFEDIRMEILEKITLSPGPHALISEFTITAKKHIGGVK